jgi:hypothetical protein
MSCHKVRRQWISSASSTLSHTATWWIKRRQTKYTLLSFDCRTRIHSFMRYTTSFVFYNKAAFFSNTSLRHIVHASIQTSHFSNIRCIDEEKNVDIQIISHIIHYDGVLNTFYQFISNGQQTRQKFQSILSISEILRFVIYMGSFVVFFRWCLFENYFLSNFDLGDGFILKSATTMTLYTQKASDVRRLYDRQIESDMMDLSRFIAHDMRT